MKILYKNAPIFYKLNGQGPVVVFIHGFLEDSSMWDYTIKSCQKVSTLVVDLPGHGKSDHFNDIHTMDQMALIVKAILDKHQITTATFVGHSMGGYVALALAQNFPEYITKLILVNSTPLADSAERLKNRRQAIKLLEQLPERFIAMAIQNLFDPENLEKLQPTIDILKSKAVKLNPKGVIACVKGMMARPDRTATLTAIKAPKIVIASQKDPIIDCQIMATLSLKAGAQFVLLPGGHMSPFEQPKRLNDLLQHYLNYCT